MPTTRHRRARATSVLIGLLALSAAGAACSSSQEKFSQAGMAIQGDSSHAGAVAADSPSSAGASGSAGASAEPASVSADQLAQTAAADDRAVIRTATIDLEVDQLDEAVRAAKATTTEHQGLVFAEQTAVGSTASSTLTLKVDGDRFDALLEDLRTLGDLAKQDISSDDVTDQLIDLDARITAAEQSLARADGFLDKANNVMELAVADSEVTKRQAELERLRAQKETLTRQVARSTVILTLRSKAEVAPVVAEAQDQPLPGFRDGLSGGISALHTVATIGAAVIGALLPFAPFVLVLVGAVLVTRRRRIRPSA